MRRKLTISSLMLAWLCANGLLCNVVQIVGWARMYHHFLQTMPAEQALRVTFDGSVPCNLCLFSQAVQEATRELMPPASATSDERENVLLLSELVPAYFVATPDYAWADLLNETGQIRARTVLLLPPRV